MLLPALMLRSGPPVMGVAPPIAALSDFSSAGAGFFLNMRTPAALLAASALKDAFVFTGVSEADSRFSSRKWRTLFNTYTLLMVFCFGAELMTVFMGTASGIRLMAGQFNPMAESAIAMLVREFEWEYVATRCQFICGLLAYILAQSLRVSKELHERPLLARAATCFLLFAGLECAAPSPPRRPRPFAGRSGRPLVDSPRPMPGACPSSTGI